jgi:transposase
MATERLSMRQTREILRQKLLLGRSNREVARSLGISASSVSNAAVRARAGKCHDWAAVDALDDVTLETRLYGEPGWAGRKSRPLPDPAYLHVQLRRKNVTLQLLHVEYLEKHPDGYRYTMFCDHYNQWLNKQSPVMRQTHRAGEKLFVDYSGQRPHIIDPRTGEVTEVELFVAVLGASNLTFAEATRTQRVGDWIGSHVHALEYIGGVPAAIVPDQLKSGVTVPCRYEPGVQRTYDELAEHYGTVILPARPGHPKDKAKVEVGVQIAERWILARLRHQTFFSLEALNERIAELLEELNARTMRVYGKSRRELFEQIERAELKRLPTSRFISGEWKLGAKVNIDYHVEYDHHYYSAPHTLVREEVDVRATTSTIEIFRHNERITSHLRSYRRGGHTTKPEHMPMAHQKHLEWSPSRIIGWASTVGPETAKLAETILAERRHPEQGYRSCLGILRLGKKYGHDRLEAACSRALTAGARSYRHVESILKHGLDRVAQDEEKSASHMLFHENVRGRNYYH